MGLGFLETMRSSGAVVVIRTPILRLGFAVWVWRLSLGFGFVCFFFKGLFRPHEARSCNKTRILPRRKA